MNFKWYQLVLIGSFIIVLSGFIASQVTEHSNIITLYNGEGVFFDVDVRDGEVLGFTITREALTEEMDPYDLSEEHMLFIVRAAAYYFFEGDDEKLENFEVFLDNLNPGMEW